MDNLHSRWKGDKAYNTKQKWLFVDVIVMLIFVLYFLKNCLCSWHIYALYLV